MFKSEAFNLMLKLAKKKFNLDKVKEDASREYMRLDLELEEICSSHAIELKELKEMSISSLYSNFGPEEAKTVESHIKRMYELWDTLTQTERMYLPPPTREILESDDLVKEFQDKKYMKRFL